MKNSIWKRAKDHKFRLPERIYAELLKDAVAKRLELESIASDNVFEIERKERLLKDAETAARKVRLIADLLVGFSLETAGKRKKVWSTQGKQAAEENRSGKCSNGCRRRKLRSGNARFRSRRILAENRF